MMSRIIPGKKKRLRWIWLAGALFLSLMYVLLIRNFPEEKSALLTVEERTWLRTHPIIRLAPDPDFPPVEYFDKNGRYSGITKDYVSLLEKKLGVRFKIVRLRDWSEIINKAKSRQIDMFFGTATPQRVGYMLFTKPFLEFPIVIIAREKVKGSLYLKELNGMKVSAVSEYAVHDFIAHNYPDLRLDLVPDVATGLRKASFGLSDAFVENMATATYFIEKEGISNLRIAGETGYFYRMAFASRKDWPELNRILEKGLAAIDDDERHAVYKKWIPVEFRTLLARKEFQVAIFTIFGAAVLTILGFVAWNRALTRQVRWRTDELEQELVERKRMEEELQHARDELEKRVEERTTDLRNANGLLQELNCTLGKRVEEEVAKNREKDFMLIQQNRQAALGEMLDHIAHQWKQPLNSISLTIQSLEDAASDGELTGEIIEETVSGIMTLLDHMAQTIDVFREFYRPDKEKKVFSIKDSIDQALAFIAPAFKFDCIGFELEVDQGLTAFGYPKEYMQVLLNILANARDIFRARGTEKRRVTIKAFAEGSKTVVTISDNAGGISETIMGKVFDIYFTSNESTGGTGIGLYMSKNIIEKNMGGSLSAVNTTEGAQFRIEISPADPELTRAAHVASPRWEESK